MKIKDFWILNYFPGATTKTRPAESTFLIRFERKLIFLCRYWSKAAIYRQVCPITWQDVMIGTPRGRFNPLPYIQESLSIHIFFARTTWTVATYNADFDKYERHFLKQHRWLLPALALTTWAGIGWWRRIEGLHFNSFWGRILLLCLNHFWFVSVQMLIHRYFALIHSSKNINDRLNLIANIDPAVRFLFVGLGELSKTRININCH